MSTTCCPDFVPIKVSQLVRYQNIDPTDFLLVIESGSANYSRRSTIADLFKVTRLVTGSYSGSFSGSYWGKIISKNANITGALSGSYFGSIVSKNTIASGSFSGSYWGKIISKNTIATGSLSGNFYGTSKGTSSGSLLGSLISKNTKATGSFSGSVYGNLVSKNAKLSGSFSGSTYGKLVSKNTNATGSFSGSFYGSIKTSLTSSYLKQTNVDDSYKFTYYNGNKLINSPYFSYNNVYNQYYMSSSYAETYLIIDSKANTSGYAQSALVLSNNYDRLKRAPTYNLGPEAWRLFTNASGSLDLSSYTGSYQFTNQNFTPKGVNAYFSGLRTVNNVFYFWPEPNSYQTINRDGSVGIGVQAPSSARLTQNTKAKLHINVFSSSFANRGTGIWPGSGTVRKLDGAILVEYSSGSLSSKTFFVSGSGNMYSAGNFTILRGITGSLSGSIFGGVVSKNVKATGSFSGSTYGNLVSKNIKATGSLSGSYFGRIISKNSLITGSFKGIDNITNFKGTGKKVSFNGTASYAVSSSYALTASYLLSGASSVNRKTVNIDAKGYGESSITFTHGCPTTPFAVILSWEAKSGASTPSGFSAGDIVKFDDVFYWGNDDDVNIQSPGASVKISGPNVTVGWANYTWTPVGYVFGLVLNGNARQTFSANQWYLKITYLY